MSPLAYSRTGTGEPLVLLHGVGMSRQAWDPVLPALAASFDVIAVDLPGFGESSAMALPPELAPAAIAAAVGELLDELGVTSPHLAGNSLGGWTALELAARRPAASVTLLSPAGLWRKDTPLYCRVSLQASRWLAHRLGRPLARLVSWRLGRILVLGQTHGRPGRLSPDTARRAIRDMATSPGFAPGLRATARIRYVGHAPIGCPVTLAFGSRDWLLRPRQSRQLEELPGHTRLATLAGCGHVPMSDDPAAVVGLIEASVKRALSARPPTPGAGVRSGR
ncbi:MAG TPA: alpha/beta fold hydrolase [Frankiaceae bacterium]|jgi:pimeloyl-ACP methyl ester carboxylesterase|nr:alpha/beta fold hydrolase [Frankiaceae bacterium]